LQRIPDLAWTVRVDLGEFRPMLGAQGHRAGKDLYRTTFAVTRDLSFIGLIRSPDRPNQSPLTGDVEDLF
jgi:hypothetical protein